MNEFLKTKPKTPETYATAKGWVDSITGELLVAIRDLDKKLGQVSEMDLSTEVKRGPGRPKGSKAKPKVRAV